MSGCYTYLLASLPVPQVATEDDLVAEDSPHLQHFADAAHQVKGCHLVEDDTAVRTGVGFYVVAGRIRFWEETEIEMSAEGASFL